MTPRAIRHLILVFVLAYSFGAPALVYAESETEPDDAAMSPESKLELRDQGVLYFRRGKYKQALGVLQQAYDKPDGRLTPSSRFTWLRQSDSRQHQGRLQHGETHSTLLIRRRAC